MGEHEMLKKICDLIGYEPVGYWTYINVSSGYSEPGYYRDGGDHGYYPDVDVREIIFTSDFREYLYDYLLLIGKEEIRVKEIIESLMRALNTPVEHLYLILGLNEQNNNLGSTTL